MEDRLSTEQKLINEISVLKRRIEALEHSESELTRENESLLKEEGKFKTIFDMARDGILLADPATKKFLLANNTICSMLGYTKEELKSLTVYDLHATKDIAHVISDIERHAMLGSPDLFEDVPVMRKDGSIFYADIGSSSVTISGTHFLVGIFRDITERKRTEEELERHRIHLEEMVKERTVELETKNATLKQFNTTLQVLLKQREDDKKDIEKQVSTNIQKLILPFVEQLKREFLDAGQQTCIDIIETHLRDISKPVLKNIMQFNFTPKEIRVAALVKDGKTSEDIAKMLNVGTESIDTHRTNIRKKLGLTSRKISLQSHLETVM